MTRSNSQRGLFPYVLFATAIGARVRRLSVMSKVMLIVGALFLVLKVDALLIVKLDESLLIRKTGTVESADPVSRGGYTVIKVRTDSGRFRVAYFPASEDYSYLRTSIGKRIDVLIHPQLCILICLIPGSLHTAVRLSIDGTEILTFQEAQKARHRARLVHIFTLIIYVAYATWMVVLPATKAVFNGGDNE